MHSISQFFSLPIELVSSILGFLDEVDLLTCTAVAKQLRKLITDSPEFQYTIELAKRRMTCVVPASDMPPYASRLNSLRAREQAWRLLDWKLEHRSKIPPSGSIYEFVGGLYATGKEDASRLTRSITFWELPTYGDASDEAESRSWTHSMEDVIIIDFSMDPAQDLLVLVTLAPASSMNLYEIHLRSIVTNETHPRAPMPKLFCLSGSETHSTTPGHPASIRIQISGNLVALLVKQAYNNFSSHLEIWDWVNNPQVSYKMKSKSGIEDFTFLSNDAFLVVRTTGSLETYTFPSPITDLSIPVSQYNYRLPQLSDGHLYWYMTISSNPGPAFTPRSCPGTGRSKQFYFPKPTERIYLCSLCVFEPAGYEQSVHCFIFFFNPQILLHPPEEWKAAARRAERRRVSPYHYAYTSPSISTQPLSFTPLPISHHTDISFKPTRSLAPTNAAASSSSATASSSFASTTPKTTMTPTPLPFRAHPRPVLPRLKPPKVAQPTQVLVVIPWHVWGPRNTRWFEDRGNTDWQYSVHGLRTIDSVRADCLPTFLGWNQGNRNEDEEAGGATSTPTGEGLHEGITLSADSNDTDTNESELSVPPRYLRLRDYNPYSIRECLQAEEVERLQCGNDKSKADNKWRGPRVVTQPTTTDVKGVFKHDIVSQLPYVEVLSEETFRVTDVMMDDCRVLLHKV